MVHLDRRYTLLCGDVIEDAVPGGTCYCLCVMTPNHTDTHMCECGREWHNPSEVPRAQP